MSTSSSKTSAFPRTPLPPKLCNLERLLFSMQQRGIDAVVASTALNTFYLCGLNAIAHKADEPRPYAVLLSRHRPEHPVLVVADYYLGSVMAHPSWIEDVRSFRAVMLPLDLPPRRDDVDRFIPYTDHSPAWLDGMRASYAEGIGEALRQALEDLGLDKACVAFDELSLAHKLGLEGAQIRDAYDPLMYARSVKTPQELELLRRSTALNERAIGDAIATWDRGMSYREFNRAYHRAVTDLGGFVRDPGAMVWGHPRGADPAITLDNGLDDFPLTPGTHVMFDCHGTLDLYCWDGGKTWVVDGEPEGKAATAAAAASAACEAVMDAMRPGARISQLQATARNAYSKHPGLNAEQLIVFFHGLGLSHMDLEQTTAHGQPNRDWILEKDMVVPLHLLQPGGERERIWVEEVVRVTPDGGEPFFSWGFDPLCGQG